MFDLFSAALLLWVAGGTVAAFIGYRLQLYKRKRRDRNAIVKAWKARLQKIEAESPKMRRVCLGLEKDDYAYVFFKYPKGSTRWHVEYLVCNAAGQTWVAKRAAVETRDEAYLIIRIWVCLRKPIDGSKMTDYTLNGIFR